LSEVRRYKAPMTPQQIDLVRTTFEQIAPHGPRVAERFYERLFALDPSARALFKNDMRVQEEKLMTMLGLAVGALDVPDVLVPMVEDLGRRHAGYNVRPEQYVKVATALLATLEDELGAAFSEQVRAAWSAAYNMLSRTMMRAAAAH
jgi:hemoglobin-like flavoprotein